MILLISYKNDFTTDFVISELNKRNLPYYRLNTDDLNSSVEITINIASNAYCIYDTVKKLSIELDSITSVYLRRIKLSKFDGEYKNIYKNEFRSCINFIIFYLKDKKWLNFYTNIIQSENKILQLIKAKGVGLKIPKTIVSTNNNSFNVLKDESLITKPLRTKNYIIGDEYKSIFTKEISISKITANKLQYPALIQSKVMKRYELRIVVVNERFFSYKINSQDYEETKIDWRLDCKNQLKYERIKIPLDVENKILMFLKELKLVFGAIDMAINTDGDYVFFEINPNGQWAWLENPEKKYISNAIIDYLS